MYNISHISNTHSQYPPLLKEIGTPPESLFIAGNLQILQESGIAVVGSRAITRYGQQACTSIVRSLVQAGLTIISGLATGVDSLAHRTALDNGGRTIAVLGCGLNPDKIYPQEHINLAKRIVESDGALISEYPPDTSAKRYYFPQRNRIIAGLALGTLAVEARKKSGALITTQCALEENRDVFAVPGSIFSTRSHGTNALLKEGAVLVDSAADILNEIGWETQKTRQEEAFAVLTILQQRIIQAIGSGYCRAEELSKHLNIAPAILAQNLTDLEINEIVRKNNDYSYEISYR